MAPYLPTLYKARHVPTKSPVCAICIDRTRGRTVQVSFGYGVTIWLCQGHASTEFLAGRSGRDAITTLMAIWRANGCLTANRHKALTAHLQSLNAKPPRHAPGSYAWPAIRLRAETLFAQGHSVPSVLERLTHARYGDCQPPTPTTIHRWHRERRWAARAP
jgi:hypothetical protein